MASLANVQRVSDGDRDTAITANATKLRIRLLDSDAPEITHDGKPGRSRGEETRADGELERQIMETVDG